jgi:ATP-binding protein involved in chromosome partitioning
VKYPGFSRHIVSFGLVKSVKVEGSDVTVQIEIATKDAKIPQQVFQDVHAILDVMEGVAAVKVDIEIKDAPEASLGWRPEMASSSVGSGS